MLGEMSLWKVIMKTPVVKQEVRRGGFVWGRDGFTWVGPTEPPVSSSSVSPTPALSPTGSNDGEEETETNGAVSEAKYQR